ncbi:30S ribosomal protein S12 methylthiotransferase RimO [Traorella massiliensis]|uniref:30S ribosomal protein S12 methylthiotransferase RimO n=1 Tax=Traorella massiliensis TaxID=1903263 RepID=UPI00248F0062|nr:30S ribosomal protein S12 methylthiotransferase RimO [Traorella massiliensis]
MKIGFVSLGCAKNLVDSEKIMGMLKEGGHEFVSKPSDAEAIIINTCGFIQSAKEEAINTILEMAEYKKKNCKKLIVCGCLAQRYKEDLEKEMPEVDRFIAIREYPQLHEILKEELQIPLHVYGKSERLSSGKPWTAYLKIAEGCSNRCTYCAIPLIRGENVSVPMEDLVEEAKDLASKGVKELVVIAQDTTKYGIDLYHRYALLELLEKLNEINGLHWIRILYMYPDEISDELIEGMKKLDKVLPYFDIPMQHSDARMLKLMNRRGDEHTVRQLIKKIRSTFEDATLRTTYIVGFPTESKQDFDKLCDFVKEIRWNKMGAFTYSIEEDTPAYDMEQTVSEEEKKERLDVLMSLQSEISYMNNRQLAGKTIEVLVEGKDGLSDKYVGRGRMHAPDDVDGIVVFTSMKHLELGSFVHVKVNDADEYDLYGELEEA